MELPLIIIPDAFTVNHHLSDLLHIDSVIHRIVIHFQLLHLFNIYIIAFEIPFDIEVFKIL